MGEFREYIIDAKSGVFKIRIPESWKITFSRVVPQGNYPEAGYCLRIYESKEKQRAVFLGIRSFFDLSIKLSVPSMSDDGVIRWDEISGDEFVMAGAILEGLKSGGKNED